MLVNLNKAWFGPDASLREPAGNPHDLPNSWKDQLPGGAEVLEEKTPEEPKPVKK